MSSVTSARFAALALAGAAVGCLPGCNAGHTGVSSSALAPGMRDEDRGRIARNVVDPNAPFTIPAPRLVMRDAILDPSGVPACSPAQLSLFESRAEINGARHAVRFTLANNQAACRLGGFPSITLLQADGTVLGGVRIRRVSDDTVQASLTSQAGGSMNDVLDAPSPQVLLPAKGQAAFELGWTSGPSCAEVSRIAIAAPGTTQSVEISRPIQLCEDQLLITAVSDAR